jgi:hypothetical protein
MSHRHVLRLGAATASSGGILTLVGNIPHPREPGQLDSAANLFGVVLRNQMWAADHFVLAIGLALLLHGFYGLMRSICTEPGATWARFAWHMAIVGVVFGIALKLTEAVAVTSIARAWDGRTGEERDLLLAAGNAVFELSMTFSVGGMLFLFGAMPALYGVAMLRSSEHSVWAAWIGVLFGLVGVIAAATQVMSGKSWLTFYVLFPIRPLSRCGLFISAFACGGWRRLLPTNQMVGCVCVRRLQAQLYISGSAGGPGQQ